MQGTYKKYGWIEIEQELVLKSFCQLNVRELYLYF